MRRATDNKRVGTAGCHWSRLQGPKLKGQSELLPCWSRRAAPHPGVAVRHTCPSPVPRCRALCAHGNMPAQGALLSVHQVGSLETFPHRSGTPRRSFPGSAPRAIGIKTRIESKTGLRELSLGWPRAQTYPKRPVVSADRGCSSKAASNPWCMPISSLCALDRHRAQAENTCSGAP